MMPSNGNLADSEDTECLLYLPASWCPLAESQVMGESQLPLSALELCGKFFCLMSLRGSVVGTPSSGNIQ